MDAGRLPRDQVGIRLPPPVSLGRTCLSGAHLIVGRRGFHLPSALSLLFRQVGEAGSHPMMPGGRVQPDTSVPILGELARLSPHN
jgi:hypothetical protein